MDLILWRHADARDPELGDDDLERPLTPRGVKQAQRMAEWLNHVLPETTRWPDSREPVLVVGHQPTLGQVAAYLMAGAPALHGPAWAIRKGAVWWLRHREREGGSEVVLAAVRGADKL